VRAKPLRTVRRKRPKVEVIGDGQTLSAPRVARHQTSRGPSRRWKSLVRSAAVATSPCAAPAGPRDSRLRTDGAACSPRRPPRTSTNASEARWARVSARWWEFVVGARCVLGRASVQVRITLVGKPAPRSSTLVGNAARDTGVGPPAGFADRSKAGGATCCDASWCAGPSEGGNAWGRRRTNGFHLTARRPPRRRRPARCATPQTG